MILRILKANHVYNFVLLPIIGGLLLLKTIIDGGTFQVVHCTTPLCSFFANSNISYTGAAIINYGLVLIISFLLFHINVRFTFLKEQTFLTSYLFLFITLAIPELHLFNPAFLSAIFLLFAIRSIFTSLEKKSAIRNAFDAGFFIGLSGIFFIQTSILILIIPATIFIIRNNQKWREAIVPFIGFLLPWLFLFSVYFVFDDVSNLIELISNSLIPKGKLFITEVPYQIHLGYILLLIVISSVFVLRNYGLKNISARRFFKVLFLIFISIVLIQFLPSVSIDGLVLLTIPVTFLLTNYLLLTRRKIWAEIFLDILIVSAFAIQFFL